MSGSTLKYAAVAALCAILALAGNGATSVFDRDEARFALAVREMQARGEALVPTNWGEPRYHKPILIYWLALASERLLGPGEFALRFPSAVCGVLTCLLTMLAARSFLAAPWRAGLVLTTALFFVIEAKICTADGLLLLSLAMSFVAWLRLRHAPPHPHRWQTLFWTGVGIGLLAKVVNVGFLLAAVAARAMLRHDTAPALRRLLFAILIVGAVGASFGPTGFLGPLALAAAAVVCVIAHRQTPGEHPKAPKMGCHWGGPLALAMFGLWVIPALIRTRAAFLTEGLLHHLFARTAQDFEGHSGFPGYYAATLMASFFPWAALAPMALRNAWRQRKQSDDAAFLLAWVAGPWVLVELTATKLPHYMLASFPALAILVAREWERRSAGGFDVPPWARRLEAILVAAPCLGLAGAAAGLATMFAWAPLRLAAAALALAALAWGGAVAAQLWRSTVRAADRTMVVMAGGAATLYLILAVLVLPAMEPLRIARPLGSAVSALVRPGERLIIHKFSHASVGFYLPRAPERINDRAAVAQALSVDSKPEALVIVPNGDNNPRFNKILQERPVLYQRVGVVRGVILPEWETHEIWIVRAGKP